MSNTGRDWSDLAAEYARLQVYYAATQARVALAPVSESSRRGMRDRLTVVQHWLSRLGPTGDLGRGVVSGEFEASRWASIANLHAKELEAIQRQCSDDNWFGQVWDEIVVPTGQGVAVAASQAAPAAFGALTLVAIIVVALAVIKVKS